MPNERTKSRAKPTGSGIGLALLISACSAAAENTSIQCQATPGFPAMSLVYEGGETGTLKVASSLGEMSLPASRQEREGENEGVKYTATGILASGPAKLLMPDRAAMEACIAGKASGDQASDIDMVTMFTDACRREVPLGTAQVPIQAKIEIAMIEAPGAYVYVTLTYDDKSNVPGEHIAIATLPPPDCVVTEPK